jgi:chromosome partitioning protein
MSTIISIINYKGGTGKTTTALNFGAALAKKAKKKVLLLDFDSQCNLSLSKGFKKPEKHIGNVLAKKATIEESVYNTDKLSIVPSTEKP